MTNSQIPEIRLSVGSCHALRMGHLLADMIPPTATILDCKRVRDAIHAAKEARTNGQV